ncbi:MAG: RluA family pseudouridine synthase [Anaerolineae bacterium]|nr:RluA family pseudouridine synthase [Anaerolineae bacterium]
MADGGLVSGLNSTVAPESTPSVVSFAVEVGGERLDKAIAVHVPDLSRATAQRLIKTGAVTVNGRLSKPSYRVQVGDEVVVRAPAEVPASVVPEHIPLDIIYEDDALLVVDKPAGMVVHPAYGHASGTLVNAVLAYCPQVADVGGPSRAGVVHRLDKDTSGLILVAKDEEVRAALQRQFKRRQVAKTYLALVEGQVQPREGVIEAPVGRDKRQRKKMAVVRSGRDARTLYRAIERFANHTLLEVRPHTGRTHQVRVHLAWLGYPVVGDVVYGRRRQRLLQGRHFLHAARLRFIHPTTKEEVEFEAPLPPELAAVLKRARHA